MRTSSLVICTVHQPREQIFNLFDKVLVLSKGNQIYFGETSGLGQWFESKLDRPLPPRTSLPDFIIDVVNVSFNETEVDDDDFDIEGSKQISDSKGKGVFDVQKAAGIFKKDGRYQKLLQSIDEINAAMDKSPPLEVG